MRSAFALLFLLSLLTQCVPVDSCNCETDISERPKLVVGIVVDQMRHDYLYRFYDRFGEGGFKRLMKEGFVQKNTHYNYVPTFTGPGHASIYTGTTPSNHGIVANNWYDRYSQSGVYCAGDSTVSTVGSDNKRAGQISPRNMLSTSIADELRLATDMKGKVIGISIKDRGAALPAGHLANGAYWYDRGSGKFVTSTFYMDELPRWVKDFNDQKLPDEYLKNTWDLLLPEDRYEGNDEEPFEAVFDGKEKPVFPYDLTASSGKRPYDFLTQTPWGNTIVNDMAMAAIKGEQLGQDDITDLLAVSYSSTDIIGHAFGPASFELQDTYLRFDKEIANLLDFLDAEVGEGNYTVFLTGDHGAVDVPQYLIDRNAPAGYFEGREVIIQGLATYLNDKYGVAKWILRETNDQIYLNHSLITERKLDLESVQREIVSYMLEQPGVSKAYTAKDMQRLPYETGIESSLQNGYYYKRSGDVLLVLDPAWTHKISYATTHGSGYGYDTHVPNIWYGHGIKQGQSVRRQNIIDIAPTLASLLNIKLTTANTGEPIIDLWE